MTKKTLYIQIVNWDKYQHYKHRNPPWIKFHNDTLDKYKYSCLQDASKLLLLSLWLLASRTNNKIPYDLKWISESARLKTKPKEDNIKELINSEWIMIYDSASNTLATCMQSADSEKSRVEKSRVEGIIPKELNTVGFLEAWKQWKDYRIEKKKRLTESTVEQQLKMLSKHPIEVAVSMIQQSIQQGWIGLFDIKEKHNATSSNAQREESRRSSFAGQKSNIGTSVDV